MNTLDFFQRVLPGSGTYCAFGVMGDRVSQVFAATLVDLLNQCENLDRRGFNAYNAMATFTVPSLGRKQANVQAVKSFYIDVDCKDPALHYPNWREALVAVGDFVAKTGLPNPVIVRSGRGLHVYWPLTSEVIPADWQPVADALKTACLAYGLKGFDPTVTADSARILRTPNTTHTETGRKVTVILDAPDTDFNSFKALLKVRDVVTIPDSTGTASTTKYKLIDNLTQRGDIPSANSQIIEIKCAQVAHLTANQSTVTEPQWYALLGVAAHCVDPEATAIRWSDQHPDYDHAKTMAKMAQWKSQTTGPATCKRLDTDNPKVCDKCRFKDKVVSPAQIGVQYEAALPPTDVLDEGAKIDLPKPFKRTSIGIVITIDDTDIEICPFDIYPVSYGYDEHLGYEISRFKWRRPHVGWKDLVFRQALLVDGEYRDFSKSIADQGIVLYNRKRTETFQLMLRSYMDELRQLQTMTNHYNSMGWKNDYKEFLIGDTLFSKDENGSVVERSTGLSMGGTSSRDRTYTTHGSYDSWRKLSVVLGSGHFPAHALAVAASFSSVLYAFTGLKGVTFSLYGETGTGKTLAQKWMQSVWGNPDELHFAAKFTMNSLFHRLSTHCHLPMTIDETTVMADKDVGDFIYWVSQGKDKARLTKTITERDPRGWSTFVTLSTNRSMASKLTSSGMETDAQMVRLLELKVPETEVFTNDSLAGAKMYRAMHANYGHAGREFVRKLLELGHDKVQKLVSRASEVFCKHFGVTFTGQERYWEQFLSLTFISGVLAKQWGIIKYDVDTSIKWALAEINVLRKEIADNRRTSFDVIADYLNEFSSSAVTIMHTVGMKPMADMTRLPRNDVRIRYDVFRKSAADPFDRGTVMIDRNHFRSWASRASYDYRGIINEIAAENAIATPRTQKSLLTKDTGIKGAQVYVFGVKMNHPVFEGVFETADTAIDSLTYGNVVSISGGSKP